jgi:CheY-like chemotaxis protein
MGPEATVRVLVVEDDASTAAGIVHGLRGAGLDVDLSTNGADGARRMLADKYDIACQRDPRGLRVTIRGACR